MKGSENNVCFCFPRRRTCISTFLLTFIIIGACLYLILPSLPVIKTGDPQTDVQSVKINGAPFNPANPIPSGDGNLAVSFTAGIPISIYSPSFLTFGIQQLRLNIKLQDKSGDVLPNFTGYGVKNNIRITMRSTSKFIINIMFNATTNLNTLTSDPAFELLRSTCLTTPNSTLPIRIGVTLGISSISWTGYKPSYSFVQSQPCPDLSQLTSMFNLPL
ncbi:hypothetical protein BC833DRAFT_574186 [Globomyces pollinis-pini]|nr:hypothetical protein BC833DRAFT_574186 [Globomyces pollinis-pini]